MPFFNACEVFRIGVEIEKNGREFYALAAEKSTDPAVKRLFQELSKWEDGHVALFQKLEDQLHGRPDDSCTFDPDGQAAMYLKAAAATHVFVGTVDLPGMVAKCDSAVDVLLAAMKFEKDSVVVYTAMKRVVPEALGNGDIDLLINEEMAHVAMLQDRIIAMNA